MRADRPFIDRVIDTVAERKFYCYALLDPRRPGVYAYGHLVFRFEPFYVGKGTGYRTSAHFTDAKRFRETGVTNETYNVAKLERILEIIDSGISESQFKAVGVVRLVENLNEFESFEHETAFIALIGRAVNRQGPLVNENDGTQFNAGYQKVGLGAFTGMRDAADSATLQDGQGQSSPRVALNADLNAQGQYVKRQGKRLHIPLPNPRSLWSCPQCLLVVAECTETPQQPGDFLYRIRGPRAEKITPVFGVPGDALFAVYVDGMVYLSNSEWNAIYDPNTGQILPWGDMIPPQPVVLAQNGYGGQLGPGVYRICYTRELPGGAYGPASAYAEISFAEGEGNIQLMNLPSDCIAWMTDANENVFLRLSSRSDIREIESGDALKTFGMVPPTPMRHLCQFSGRVFGAVGTRLVYSEAYRYDLFRPTSFFEFHSRPTMIAPVANAHGFGMYVGFVDRCIFLYGASPSEMVAKDIGVGVVEGTLAYCQNLPDLGNNVPVWVAKDGIVAGGPDGSLFNLTANKVELQPGLSGASFFRMYKGMPQYLAAFLQGKGRAGVGFGDSATCEVVRKGSVIAS